MRMFHIAWKNLWRRPSRTLLTISGLAIAVAAVVSLVGVSETLQTSFLSLYTKRGADLIVQRRGGTMQISKGMPIAFRDQMKKLPDIGEIVGGLMDMVSFEKQDIFMAIVNGWEPNSSIFERINVVEGRRLKAEDDKSVMLGKILATNLGKKTGDSVELYGKPFRVIGVFESFSVYENGAVFMLLDELQRQMDRPGQVTGFVVHAASSGDTAAIERLRKNINELDPKIAATPTAEFVESLSQMRVTRVMSWVIAIIAVALGSIGVLNTMAMSIFERRAEIGTLRAIGWSKWRIIRMIVNESLMLATAGAMIGVVLGMLGIFALSRWRVTSNLIQGDISWRAIVEGIVLAAGMAVIGSLYPAYQSADAAPLDSLRSIG